MKREYTGKPWSGLAPAVDAHLARWDRLHRVQSAAHLLERSLKERIPQAQLQKVLNMPALQQWSMFAMSYGITTENGVPMQQLFLTEGTTISGREMREADKTAIPMAGKFAIREHDMLDKAVTHYVSAEVVNEISIAASEGTCDPLWETDLVARHGFAVFEEPFLINDLHPDTGVATTDIWLGIRALGWRYTDHILSGDPNDLIEGQGIELFVYTTAEDYDNIYMASLEDGGYEHQEPLGQPPHDFLIIDVIPWMFGRQWDVNDTDDPEHVPGFLPAPVATQRRWFHTFMRFCWQEIIVKQAHHDNRAERRQWERLAKKKEMLDYTVLRLRRVVDPNHVAYEGGGIPLEHRVRVRAHWTRQYYPTMGPARLPDGRMNPESHRLIWIEAYWKGPEDGPLGPLHSATSVVR